MRRRKLHVGFIFGLVAVAGGGCASTQPPFSSVGPPTLGSQLPRVEAPTSPAPVDEPRGVLTLHRALSLALVHNPELAVFSWEVRAREAESVQAGVRPNPEFAADIENFGGTGDASGFQSTETTLALSQVVELGGKRSKRISMTRLERDLAAWDYESKRIDVLTKTTTAFIDVRAAQEQLALAEELTQVADRLLQSVVRRVRAGAISQVEESRARVALETTRIDRNRRSRELSVARRRLVAQWAGDEEDFTTVQADLDTLQPLPELSTLTGLIEQTPALAKWTTELARRKAQEELAGSAGVPDLSIGAGLRHFSASGDVGAVVGISLPLPLFDRNDAAINAAQIRVTQTAYARQSVATAIQTQIQAAHAEAAASLDEATALKNRAIPEAESAFALAEEFYSRGRMSLTDVLDTERTLFELRTRLVEAQLRYHKEVAELERLTGTPLSHGAHESRRP